VEVKEKEHRYFELVMNKRYKYMERAECTEEEANDDFLAHEKKAARIWNKERPRKER
jgi:hypothetical protein